MKLPGGEAIHRTGDAQCESWMPDGRSNTQRSLIIVALVLSMRRLVKRESFITAVFAMKTIRSRSKRRRL